MVNLLAQNHQIGFVITSHAYDEYSKKENDFQLFAESNNIPFLLTESINSNEVRSIVKKHCPPIGLSINCRTRLNADLLQCFPRGVINVHFGDLPRYRGNAVINWAIINGEPKVTCTLHYMNEELDAGPILIKKDFPIDETTYYGEIYSQISEAVPGLLATCISGIESETIRPEPQSRLGASPSRCYPRLPSDSELHFHMPAAHLARLVRASSEPLHGAFSFYKNERITIWRARAESLPVKCYGVPGSVIQRNGIDGSITILTGDGALILGEVEMGNTGRRKPFEIIRSLRDRLGFHYHQATLDLMDRIPALENRRHPS